MSWGELKILIPRLLRDQTEELRKNKKGIKAVLLDSGDTLIDEGTRIYSEDRENLVLSAKSIDTSRQLLEGLKERGYLTALVADGLEQSFHNVLKKNGFWINLMRFPFLRIAASPNQARASLSKH